MSKDNGGPDSDRELLELAAKAAGVELKWSSEPDMPPRIAQTWHNWNPLTEDGDALRLAVKLRLCVDIYSEGTTVRDSDHTEASEHSADNGLATRRAIVRAAAAIGAGLAQFPTADEIRENWT